MYVRSPLTMQFQPPTIYLNSNDRIHFQVRATRTRAWRETAWVYAKVNRLPRLEKARIVVTYGFPNRRRRDVGNLYPTSKAIVDGLVDAGVLDDDDDTHLIGPDQRRSPQLDRTCTVHLDIYPLDADQ